MNHRRDFSGAACMRVEDQPATARRRAVRRRHRAFPALLHAAFVRSPVAHGLLRRIDVAAARAPRGRPCGARLCGPAAADDLRPHSAGAAVGGDPFRCRAAWLAAREVCHVGEPMAMVVAASRRVAEDAARLVEIDCEPLPAVVDPFAAVAPERHGRGSIARTISSPAPPSNTATSMRAFARRRASSSPSASISTRAAAIPIEPRGVMARFDAAEQSLTVWDGTQMPHRAKAVLVRRSGLAEHQVRVIAPDVGGGFGPKAVFHPEELAVPAAAMLLGRPVKWIEDRAENFVATAAERNQVWEARPRSPRTGGCSAFAGRLLSRPRRHHALWRRAALQRLHQPDRPLCAAGLSHGHHVLHDQHAAGHADARRRAAAGHLS